MTGHELLHWIRAEPSTRQLRTYLMGHFRLQLETVKGQGKGARGYWLKPVNAEGYAAWAGQIKLLLFQPSDTVIESR